MKKLIAFILTLAIVGGLVFIFVANHFAMTTVITHNQEKSLNILNKSIEKFSQASEVDYTFTYTVSAEGETEKTVVNVKQKTVKNEDETTKTIYEATVKQGNKTVHYWYDGENYYEKDGDSRKLLDSPNGLVATSQAIIDLSLSQPVELNEGEKIKAGIHFSFKPFYFIGERFKISNNDGTVKYYTDVVGNFRGISHTSESDGVKTTVTIKINKTKGVKVAQLSETQKESYVVA